MPWVKCPRVKRLTKSSETYKIKTKNRLPRKNYAEREKIIIVYLVADADGVGVIFRL
jgi:hypothetical protein